MKTVIITIRGFYDATADTVVPVKTLNINEGGYVTFVDVDGTPWHSELSEVRAITLSSE